MVYLEPKGCVYIVAGWKSIQQRRAVVCQRTGVVVEAAFKDLDNYTRLHMKKIKQERPDKSGRKRSSIYNHLG